jgi:hypothetical protein
MRACTHAGPRAFGRTTRARCELRLPQRRDALHADVLAAHRSSDVSKPSTSVGVSICRSLARGTSLGAAAGSAAHCWVDAHAVQSMLPVGLPADVRSCASTPKHGFATCADPFGSPWLRESNRFPLRPRRRCVHSGRAVGRRLPAAPIVVFLWTVDRRLLVGSVGADPPARQRRMRRDCAFHSPQWSSRRGRSSDEAPADGSWCTVGPLVGFAFGLVSPATSFMGAMAHRRV